jgi:hypothetical protein
MPVPNDHLCQACDQPMLTDYTPEALYYACQNPDCVCAQIEDIKQCPKCGSTHLRKCYETTVTDCLDDDGKWHRLFERGVHDARYICEKCDITFQKSSYARHMRMREQSKKAPNKTSTAKEVIVDALHRFGPKDL